MRTDWDIFPVYFSGLQLAGIRCFGKDGEYVPFNKTKQTSQWNIILGNNGSGKTTILKSIVAVWTLETSFVSKIDFKALKRDTKQDSIIIFQIGINWQDDSQNIPAFSEAPIRLGPNNISFVGHGRLISKMPLFAYGASRLIGEGALSQSMPEFPAASLFDDDAHLVNAEEWLLRTDYVEQGQSKKNGERKTQKVIGLLLELFAGEVKEIKIDKEDGNPKVLFLTQFGWVRLHNLSLGYKSLIAWMVDLAARMMERYPDSKKPLEEPAIVLVDEIDLHLHPSFQRRLTGWLSGIFKKTQFIVTAHSPLVAQAGAEANIILLTRENDTVRVSQNPVDIRQWRIDQILTSDLFGLSSPHSQSTEAMLSERRSILEKAAPKAAESKKLKNLDAEIEKMPIGDTQSEIEGFELMKEFARQLSAKKQRGEL